jgi:oligogalacturonide lyase
MKAQRTYSLEKRAYADPRTGRQVIQLTQGDAQNWGAYASLTPFSADERFLVFDSNRTGRWEIFRVEIESGEITQLSNREGVQRETLNVPSPGREVGYIAGPRIWAVDLATGEERCAVDASAVTEGALHSYLTFSPDGSKTLLLYKPRGREGSALAVAATDGSFIEPVFCFEGGISHPRWVPGDARTASYAPHPDRQDDPKETYERRARACQLDLETGKSFPLLVMPPGWRCTHEHWAPDGSRIYVHRKHVPNWVPTSIVSVPKGGGEIITHYTHETLRLGHSGISADGRYMAIDVQEPNHNPLLLLDLATGDAELLCWPDAGISREHSRFAAHPHPSFSPSGQWIAYTSDCAGTPNVYLVRNPRCAM